ncbi:OmpA family protein [Nocardiopsis alba]|uniref:OmpA family protein n=1 Tax=Nocardiopsis alba TaxID=53437 RepID=UPI00366ED421
MNSPCTPLRSGAALAALVLVVTACSPDGEPEPEPDGPEAEQITVDYPDGPFERTGVSGGTSRRLPSTMRVDEIVSYSDRTVLRMTLSPGGEDGDLHLTGDSFAGGMIGANSRTPLGLRMIDPVGQALYVPAHEDGFVGSEMSAYVVGGVDYEVEAHFAPLPAGTRRVSVMVPGTQGAFSGMPVGDLSDQPWDPADAPTEEAPSHWDVSSGETVTFPVTDGEVPEAGLDLYGIVESTEVVRETSATEHRVDLDADVLFDFDESELTDEAAATLDEVVAETREKADPELPPITIVGHTDGKGDDDHNGPLSEARAEAVRAYLEEELGQDYEYESEGRGSDEPVAEEGGDDDEEARARNRRVEISYNILVEEESERVGEEETVSARVGTGNIAAPAPYVEASEEPLVTGEGVTMQGHEYGFSLYSLRRDGAFVVAEIDLTNESGRTVTAARGAAFWERGVQGGRFGSFGIQDPDSGDVYRSLRIGEAAGADTEYLEPVGFPYLNDDGTTNRVHLYFPAPPLEVDTVTLKSGPFGEFEDLRLD